MTYSHFAINRYPVSTSFSLMDDLGKMTANSQRTKKMIGPFAKALLVETYEDIYAVDPEDHVVGWELRNYGDFAPDQVAMVKELVRPESRILIVGAHIGTVAIPLSKLCSEVVAIEANPQSFQLLEFNLHVNQVENCRAYNIAANDKAEYLGFLMSRVNSGGSKRVPVVSDRMYDYDRPEEIAVPGFPLDEFLRDQAFDIIIMDIEGSEYFALKGMQRLLEASRCLVIEFLPHHLRNVSGIDVSRFLDAMPSFETMTVPSLNKKVGAGAFSEVLTYMYDNELGDDGLIFEK